PFLSSSFITALYPPLTARDGGVWPTPFLDFTSALFSSSSFIIASRPCPYIAARDSGVWPSSSLDSTSAHSSNSSFTPASPPSSSAHQCGVRPLLDFRSTSAPLLEQQLHNRLAPMPVHCGPR